LWTQDTGAGLIHRQENIEEVIEDAVTMAVPRACLDDDSVMNIFEMDPNNKIMDIKEIIGNHLV
jgi:hypothetical protein